MIIENNPLYILFLVFIFYSCSFNNKKEKKQFPKKNKINLKTKTKKVAKKKIKNIDPLFWIVDRVGFQNILVINNNDELINRLSIYYNTIDYLEFEEETFNDNYRNIIKKSSFKKVDYKKYDKIIINIKKRKKYKNLVWTILNNINRLKTKLILINRRKKTGINYSEYDITADRSEIYWHCNKNEKIEICSCYKSFDWVRNNAVKKIKIMMGKNVYHRVVKNISKTEKVYCLRDSHSFKYIDLLDKKTVKIFGYLTKVNNHLVVDIPSFRTEGMRFVIKKGKIYEKLRKYIPQDITITNRYMETEFEQFCKNRVKKCKSFFKNRFMFESYVPYLNFTRFYPLMISIKGKYEYLFSGVDLGSNREKQKKYLKMLGLNFKKYRHYYLDAAFVIEPESYKMELNLKDKQALDKEKKSLTEYLCSLNNLKNVKYQLSTYLIKIYRIENYLKRIINISEYLKRNKYYYLQFKDELEKDKFYLKYIYQNINSFSMKEYQKYIKVDNCKNKKFKDRNTWF